MERARLLDEQPDFQYLDGIRQKDHDAFTTLYRKYFKGLVLVADKYVKEIGVAKEIVQDVFLKIWEHPDELYHVTSIKAYLYRTVVNIALNHIKREKNIVQHHQKIADTLTHHDAEALHEEQELKLAIFREIENLPPQCKRVFKMSRFEGLKYREIALALDISEKTVENHMIKALKILRERLYDKNVADNTYKLKIMMLFFGSAFELLASHYYLP